MIVRERVPKPQLIDSKTPSNVVATKAGVITKIEALQGVELNVDFVSILAQAQRAISTNAKTKVGMKKGDDSFSIYGNVE